MKVERFRRATVNTRSWRLTGK